MKFTMRQGGELMTTIRVEIHIDFQRIVAGVYAAMSCNEPPPRSRRAAVKAAGEEVLKRGEFYIDDEIELAVWEKAEAYTSKLFPELVT